MGRVVPRKEFSNRARRQRAPRVKAGVAELGGRGGGRRDFAQGGGLDGPRAEAALAVTGGLVGHAAASD
jgi:alanyl-tRNA synthetase